MENKTWLSILANVVAGIFSKGADPTVGVTIPLDSPAADPTSQIDWTDSMCQITPRFTVGDACTLHAWNRLATEDDGLTTQVKANLVALCQKMEEITDFLGCSMNIHCMFRSQAYNQQVVKTIPADVHSFGMAIDFDCNDTISIDELHAKLEPVLEQYNIRMERNTATWCHLDTHPVVNARYFLA